MISPADRKLFAIVVGLTAAAGILHGTEGNPVLPFVVSAAALAAMASLVARCVEALGDKVGPGPTALMQTFLGNLPELFVIIFSLKAGLYEVVKATLVGSILANVLLITGLAFVVGGLKHGTQKFNQTTSRHLGLLTFVSILILAIPTATSMLHTAAADHERALTVVVSIVLLAVFAMSLPSALKSGGHGEVNSSAEATDARHDVNEVGDWSLGLAVAMLAISGLGAALVSDWFVAALTPAMDAMHINAAFAGLVIVAIAGNAVENVVGIQLAARNEPDFALQVIMQSPVQIAMIIAPVVALAAPLVGAGTFTLVLAPMLLAVLVVSAIVAYMVVEDGESTWFEGATMLGFYAAIAAAFWWG
jgi:Ca2+:H+ antiporter